MAISGQQLRLKWKEAWVDGVVEFGSDNRKSLIVRFGAIIDGCVGQIALLQGEDGVYCNLLTGTPIALEWM